jgi:hypothetical protein
MGSTLDEIQEAGRAKVNLVVSYSGLAAAKELQKIFGTPYVVGTPCGSAFSKELIRKLKTVAEAGENNDLLQTISYESVRKVSATPDTPDITLIGESVLSGSLAAAISAECDKSVQVLCPLETEPLLLSTGDYITPDEDDLIPYLMKSKIVIADPLYQPICPKSCQFIPLPHEAFSGRIYRKDIPDLIINFDKLAGHISYAG